jgi:hypothetical protein
VISIQLAFDRAVHPQFVAVRTSTSASRFLELT